MPVTPRRLPRDVRSDLDLRAGEHVIAWGRGPSGHVVATDRALHVEGPDWRRIPWHRVVRAAWSEPALELVVQEQPGLPVEDLLLALDPAGDLPVVVRERVTGSIVAQQLIEVAGGHGARAVARRDSDTSEITWTVSLDAALDAGDPGVRRAADAALADLRRQLGV